MDGSKLPALEGSISVSKVRGQHVGSLISEVGWKMPKCDVEVTSFVKLHAHTPRDLEFI